MGELYISATWITANGSDILGFSKSAQIIFRLEHPHCADTTQHPEEDKRSIQQHVYPSQRATIDRNKNLALPRDPGWKAEIPSHGATYFLRWSAVHFACCCFDKSPVRVTASFWHLLALAAFPLVRLFFFCRCAECSVMSGPNCSMYFFQWAKLKKVKKKGYICRFLVASCQARLVLLDLRKGQFVVLCILLFFFPRRWNVTWFNHTDAWKD